MAEWLLRWIVNSCFGTIGSNPIDPILFSECCIIGNAFGLGLKAVGSSPATLKIIQVA